jgi:hypothetical protein
MPQFSEIEFTCVDVRGKTITCLYDDWQYLIKHQEMRNQQKVVQDIIQSPDFINGDKDFKNRHSYYKFTTLPRLGETYVKVIVEFKTELLGTEKGFVYNAFACRGEKQGEVRKWTKPSIEKPRNQP